MKKPSRVTVIFAALGVFLMLCGAAALIAVGHASPTMMGKALSGMACWFFAAALFLIAALTWEK